LALEDSAAGQATPGPGNPTVVLAVDEFRPRNVQPSPGRQWAPVVRRNKKRAPDDPRRRWQRVAGKRSQGVQHLFGALDMNRGRLDGHRKTTKNR
jgi:hypothetical protein